MDVMTAIKGRRSVRNFTDKPIETELIEKLKEALIWAPSAGNMQSRHFYFISDKTVKERLAEASLDQWFIAEAPLTIIGAADTNISRKYGERGVELYSIEDVSVSMQNLMLYAHSVGLGSTWVGSFSEDKVRSIVSMPANLRPIAIVPVGYPAEELPSAPPRVRPEEAVTEL
ncbi:MAG: nitroreductase family protein [Thermodesulfobacteriota bacterium]